jgi:hypothetical protein
MTARLRPFALLNSGEIETPFVDGFTVVSADNAERDRLTQLWQSEHGGAVAFIAASDLPKQEGRAALASDVLRRELAIAEAQEALVAAEQKHQEALDVVARTRPTRRSLRSAHRPKNPRSTRPGSKARSSSWPTR